MQYLTNEIADQIQAWRDERNRLKNAIIENLKTQGVFIGARFSLLGIVWAVEVVQISICDELSEPIIFYKEQSLYDDKPFGKVDSKELWQFYRDIDTNPLPF